jgi:hypothetical protein
MHALGISVYLLKYYRGRVSNQSEHVRINQVLKDKHNLSLLTTAMSHYPLEGADCRHAYSHICASLIRGVNVGARLRRHRGQSEPPLNHPWQLRAAARRAASWDYTNTQHTTRHNANAAVIY